MRSNVHKNISNIILLCHLEPGSVAFNIWKRDLEKKGDNMQIKLTEKMEKIQNTAKMSEYKHVKCYPPGNMLFFISTFFLQKLSDSDSEDYRIF